MGSATLNVEDVNAELNIAVDDVSISVVAANDTVQVTMGVPINIHDVTYVNADSYLRFDGSTGDTYLVYNSSEARLEVWVNGVLKSFFD